MNPDIIQRFGEVAGRAIQLARTEGEIASFSHQSINDVVVELRTRHDTEAADFLEAVSDLVLWMKSERPDRLMWTDELLSFASYQPESLTIKDMQGIIDKLAEFIANVVRNTQPMRSASRHA